MVPIAHEQNIICSKTRLDGTTHEQTIICGQLFAGHVMDSRPIGREEKTHRMIIDIKDIVFGFLDTPTCDSDCMLLNYIILENKYLIYRTTLNKTSLSLKLLFEKI